MDDRERKIRLVSQLHKLTLDGELSWSQQTDPDPVTNDEFLFSAKYQAERDGLTFVLYKVQRRHSGTIAGVNGQAMADLGKRTENYVLEIKDSGWRVIEALSEPEEVRGLSGLFRSVRVKTTGVEEKIDRILDLSSNKSQPAA